MTNSLDNSGNVRAWLMPGLLLLSLAGCHLARERSVTNNGLPDRYAIELGQLIIRSDVPLQRDEPLLDELQDLREEIIATLELNSPRRPVVVHLFANEEHYTKYMRAAFPNLPPRRAFFVGSPTELGVYAFWGDNVEEDLRHEYTHGVLHASLKTVPLWLDEGLAEYFETTRGGSGRLHPEHARRLALAVSNGWRPDLSRLEKLEDVAQMQRADYQESWAWVHYLLHEAPDGSEVLVDYCQELAQTSNPPQFETQLRPLFPDAELRLTSYITMVLRTE
ncbi:MAG: DUF1570 domain-containing protein [Planctomycetaceae bacterium]|nr:DUF1570 domain-containing protein [Planctomycetaceae bacterium]